MDREKKRTEDRVLDSPTFERKEKEDTTGKDSGP